MAGGFVPVPDWFAWENQDCGLAVADVDGDVVSTGRPVSAAALNAGVGQGGAFVDTDLADELRIIDLNVTSTSPRRCTWPSACSGTWWPVTTAGC